MGIDKSNPFEGNYDPQTFEFGSGGRDIEIQPADDGVEEGISATVAQGLDKSDPWGRRDIN
jgi:hypothetical protein